MKRGKQLPVHPGEVLAEEFLGPLGVSQYKLAKDIRVPARRINEIVHGTRSITADTALRLGRFFGTSAQLWLNLQSEFDLDSLADAIGSRLEKEITVYRPSEILARSRRETSVPPQSRPRSAAGDSRSRSARTSSRRRAQ